MDTFDWIAAVGLSVVGLIVAWIIFVTVAMRVIEANHRIEHTVKQAVEARVIALKVETEGNQFLCYNAKTQDFVCQGQNLTEIRDRFRQRFPNKSATVVDGDPSVVAILKQQLESQTPN